MLLRILALILIFKFECIYEGTEYLIVCSIIPTMNMLIFV